MTAVIIAATTPITVSTCLRAQETYYRDFRPGPSVSPEFRPSPGVDASGINLEASFFGGFNLGGANFQGANLRDAKFLQIDTFCAKTMAYLPISFQGADLRNVLWVEFERQGLQGCNFADARIEGMSAGRDRPSNFLTPDQIRSTMSYKIKNLSGFDMVGGQLSGREMPESLQGWTKVSDDRVIRQIALDFSGFDLRRTYFGSGDFTRSDFTDAYGQDAAFSGVRITHEQTASTLSWRGRVLDVSTIGTPLRLTFRGMDCSGWDFSRRNLRGSRFESVDLTGAIFCEANLRDVVFQVSKCAGADFSGEKVVG
ncbi:MAG: pentapeptide repeat-containing protein [Pirellulaceae bacterium]|nr:pentapeptide repeat-containing protein [Pirellulaceae bacterium]